MTKQIDDCRIYVACLASYNSGRLHGTWIDCDGKDSADIWGEINAMLAKSPEPNVRRRICPECGHYQTVSDHSRTSDHCNNCESDLTKAPIFPSAEEWAVHDHEGFAGLITSEWPSIDDIVVMVDGLTGEYRQGFIYLCTDQYMSPADAIDKMADVQVWEPNNYMSKERMLAEYAQDFYEDTGSLPDNLPEELANNIDWHGIGHDWEQEGAIEITDIDGETVLIGNAQDF